MDFSSPIPTSTDPGDLGRRVAQRRQSLGLTVEDLAQRAGMHAGYLTYVETHAEAQPGLAACARLAAALGTTVAWLRGGGVDQPAGAESHGGHDPHLDVLDESESLALLDGGGIGRAVFDDERGPVALPVNFRMDAGALVFRTGHGAIAAAVLAGRPISVEVDRIDEAQDEGWSVLVGGDPELVTEQAEVDRVIALGLEPWAGGERDSVVRLKPVMVSGRRIRHG